jgi:hypothetical protein
MIIIKINNTKKYKRMHFKITPEELKYWREKIPKKIESETKDFIINGFFQ